MLGDLVRCSITAFVHSWSKTNSCMTTTDMHRREHSWATMLCVAVTTNKDIKWLI